MFPDVTIKGKGLCLRAFITTFSKLSSCITMTRLIRVRGGKLKQLYQTDR